MTDKNMCPHGDIISFVQLLSTLPTNLPKDQPPNIWEHEVTREWELDPSSKLIFFSKLIFTMIKGLRKDKLETIAN